MQQALAFGGSGYFPERLVREHLDSGRFQLVPESPASSFRPTRCSRVKATTTLSTTLEGLRMLAQKEARGRG